jgi:hypothetical protein
MEEHHETDQENIIIAGMFLGRLRDNALHITSSQPGACTFLSDGPHPGGN